MALSEALANMGANYRFSARVRGGRLPRLLYLTAYYACFILLRWGDRHGRALRLLKRCGASDVPVEVRTPDGTILAMDLHTAFDPLFAIVGCGDYFQREGFRPGQGQIVIDVGANVGIYTTLAARLVGEAGRVIAIEPHPGNFELLSANVARNRLSNVRLVRAAASDTEGRGELFLHERGINHSLSRRAAGSLPVDLVAIDRVARRLPRLDLVKVDAEGAVPAVLAGARETLRIFRPRVVFERDAAEESRGAAELLEDLGYDAEAVGPLCYARPRGRLDG